MESLREFFMKTKNMALWEFNKFSSHVVNRHEQNKIKNIINRLSLWPKIGGILINRWLNDGFNILNEIEREE